ncbi:retinol dehydrogenase 11 isoform X1 [Drosophila gunungcola]|uniref:retinol dehydrogenase 11 isoform X1 n=1 Tax=Drosophila gunungcola TaxID=103775 RepID=UPI0022E95D6F|nr:retinol dehydrogenase 11 isoform X1 [Drosophila gunungcola]XP_052841642.1 retinol dehydrogenase 11 isoform X1 [Drosophila gunungcola]
MEIIIHFLHKIAPIFLAHGIVGIIAFCVRLYMQGGKFRKQTDETGKVAIVTGGNTGLGRETVMELARRGATVYMACRSKEKGERARKEIVKRTGNPNVFSRECDLSSLDSIRQFAADFKKEQSQLHVLINNAGVFWEPRRLTKEGFEMHLGVNHIGHFLLTNLLLDVLERTAPSRVVVVASKAHERGQIHVEDMHGQDFYDEGVAYCQSKLANILFARELAKRLEGTGVTVNALNPGIADTEIARNMIFFQTKFAQYVDPSEAAALVSDEDPQKRGPDHVICCPGPRSRQGVGPVLQRLQTGSFSSRCFGRSDGQLAVGPVGEVGANCSLNWVIRVLLSS